MSSVASVGAADSMVGGTSSTGSCTTMPLPATNASSNWNSTPSLAYTNGHAGSYGTCLVPIAALAVQRATGWYASPSHCPTTVALGASCSTGTMHGVASSWGIVWMFAP